MSAPPVLDWPTVWQDSREPDPAHDAPSALFWPCVYVPKSKSRPGHVAALPLERRHLATGDYTLPGLENVVAIERKALGDLLSTLFGRPTDSVGEARANLGRFRAELERMRAMPTGSLRLLVIEASQRDVWEGRYRSRASAVSIINLVDSFLVDYCVAPYWAGSRDGAQYAVGNVLRRIAEQARGEGEGFVKAIERGVAGHRPWLAQHTGEVVG